MSGLILVSHNQHQSSTLASIYDRILTRRGGLWISWDGKKAPPTSEITRDLSFRHGNDYDTLSFPLTRSEREEGYQGYVHQGLWPVFHQRPDLAHFTPQSMHSYRQLNEVYARAIAEYAMPDDAIWIQDYHFIPVAKMLRDAGLTQRIGLFFHQPFPSGQMFEAIPDWRWLVESLLCCDVLGFQTAQDMNNFLLWIESEFRAERMGKTLFRIHGRLISTGVFPVGIDLNDVLALQESNSCQFMEQQCRERLPENSILSGGHLDDSAGLPYRISAIEVLLRQHNQYAGNVMLLQLASSASGHAHRQKEISHDLENICGEVNGVHGMLNWYPVSYLNHHYSREELAGVYRASRVALVTPLMAGMSLMAKMYAALQDPANPGVLILSQFAGAAEHMDGALIVNPYDPDAIADAIHTALKLPLRERQNRHARLMKNIHLYDCHWWADRFISRLMNEEGESSTQVYQSIVPGAGFSGRARY
ncbi:trehalose-6-phosphate synthase [Pantoea sp. S61]|uniref:alpha,alpha-trehalose-phosphate synthase (UDP-forming) n=1 Tax=Pantoea sp. S61 TaxID=2767442 RepID=UPI00190D37AE|nr:trehalose-6-phosphate synthase [Pantoea sp. S61]MBK0122171.1 trehalose-6-phosphate synthase [Pantoea sp. S61]MBK0123120.1 trehalose-6-phosphate synthase [Pantoea sp. S61]